MEYRYWDNDDDFEVMPCGFNLQQGYRCQSFCKLLHRYVVTMPLSAIKAAGRSDCDQPVKWGELLAEGALIGANNLKVKSCQQGFLWAIRAHFWLLLYLLQRVIASFLIHTYRNFDFFCKTQRIFGATRQADFLEYTYFVFYPQAFLLKILLKILYVVISLWLLVC